MEDKPITKEEREKLHEQEIQGKINSDKRKKLTKQIVIYSIIIVILATIIYIPISNSNKPGMLKKTVEFYKRKWEFSTRRFRPEFIDKIWKSKRRKKSLTYLGRF